MKNLLAAVLLVGIANPSFAAADEVGEKQCVKNFTQEGSFFKGTTYKTWQEFGDQPYDSVFRKVAQAVAINNWGDVKADKELGIISAGQAVTMGNGSVAPLTVVVKEKAEGVIRVEATFGTAGGQKAATKTVREELCKLVEAPTE